MTVMGGRHTISETRYLMNEKSSEIRQWNAELLRYLPEWEAKDPEKAKEIAEAWPIFVARWKAAALKVNLMLTAQSNATPFLPDSVIPAETEFQMLLKALTVEEGRWQKGDFNWFANEAGKADIPITIKIRQPDEIDWELEVYQGADKVTKVVENNVLPTAAMLVGAACGVYLVGQIISRR